MSRSRFSLAFETERAKGFLSWPKQVMDNWLKQRVLLVPAGSRRLRSAKRLPEPTSCFGCAGGASSAHRARQVTAGVISVVLGGALAGLALGMIVVHYLEPLLYQVKPADPAMLAFPWVTILTTTLLAALQPVVRIVRIDPAQILRSE